MQVLPPDEVIIWGLTFSPDANYIDFIRSEKPIFEDTHLYRMPVLGGIASPYVDEVALPLEDLLEPGIRLGPVRDRHDEQLAAAAHERAHGKATATHTAKCACVDWAAAHRDQPAEPRLDVRRERLAVARGKGDDPVEHLVELRLDGGLVGEARELRQERGQLSCWSPGRSRRYSPYWTVLLGM